MFLDYIQWLVHALDIFIVSYLIYRLILVLRGTRAISLIKGVVLLLIALGVSSFFQLQTVSWIIDKLLPVGFLALVIIFQPELRRALEQFGRGRLLNRWLGRTPDSMDNTSLIKILTKTAKKLAENKDGPIGALVVIECQTGVSEYLESGTLLNAELSEELLVSIFVKQSPLHDGAVVIRNQQIVAAGCFLPPPNKQAEVPIEFGSRHRAAIGISEVSDAIVLVVSEEKGHISLARNGLIQRNLSEELLNRNLHDMLRGPARETASFWKKKGGENG
jgi:diadenylate cyclase